MADPGMHVDGGFNLLEWLRFAWLPVLGLATWALKATLGPIVEKLSDLRSRVTELEQKLELLEDKTLDRFEKTRAEIHTVGREHSKEIAAVRGEMPSGPEISRQLTELRSAIKEMREEGKADRRESEQRIVKTIDTLMQSRADAEMARVRR